MYVMCNIDFFGLLYPYPLKTNCGEMLFISECMFKNAYALTSKMVNIYV